MRRLGASRTASSPRSTRAVMRMARSIRSASRSVKPSLSSISIRTSGKRSRNEGSSGAMNMRPNEVGRRCAAALRRQRAPGDTRLGIVDARQDRQHVGMEARALFGQFQPPRGAPDQFRTQPLLQPRQPLRHHRRGKPQRARRARQAAAGHDLREKPIVPVPVHWFPEEGVS
jgi:hypothetical protein